jgi:hypothetical protein
MQMERKIISKLHKREKKQRVAMNADGEEGEEPISEEVTRGGKERTAIKGQIQ